MGQYANKHVSHDHASVRSRTAVRAPRASAGRGLRVQTKLRIGAAGDRYEQEADRVAALVMARLRGGASGDGGVAPHGSATESVATGTGATVDGAESGAHQHGPGCATTDAAAPAITPVTAGPVINRLVEGSDDGGGTASASVEHAVGRASGGRPLEAHVRERMESAFGRDLSGVRIHTGGEADTMARSMGATAFTYGSSIYLANGAYAPSTPEGQRLLAHELTHVVQQGAAGPTGGEGTHVQRWIGPAFVGEMREQDGVVGKLTSTTDMDDVPGEFLDLAATLQQTANAVQGGISFDDAESFADLEGVGGTTAVLGALGGVRTMVGGGFEVYDGIKHARKKGLGSSIHNNLGAQEIESGVTDLIGGGGDITSSVADIVSTFGGSEIPVIGAVNDFYQAGVKTKRAIEDSVAAEKLRRQGHHAKHDADHYLPEDVRRARLEAFQLKYATYQQARTARKQASWKQGPGLRIKELELKAGFKSGDLARYEKVMGAVRASAAELGVDADDAFTLAYLQQHNIKEFGKGSRYRTAYDREVATGAATASEDYTDARDLKKVAKFGHRRKAETATVNSVEAAGHALDGAGTFTGGADFGATKGTGKLLKAGAAAYKGIKSTVKRARRIHKLRKAKNEVAYGGKRDRGVGWGIKSFFVGNVSGSQEKVVKAIGAGTETKHHLVPGKEKKGVTKLKVKTTKGVDLSGKSDQDKARLIKMLTIQAKRKVADLVRCLGSRNDHVFKRACAILHVIAETNLAGALSKIKDRDLVEFRRLARAVADGTATNAESASYDSLKSSIESTFEKQLSGIGG